jgi:hypothetical protein
MSAADAQTTYKHSPPGAICTSYVYASSRARPIPPIPSAWREIVATTGPSIDPSVICARRSAQSPRMKRVSSRPVDLLRYVLQYVSSGGVVERTRALAHRHRVMQAPSLGHHAEEFLVGARRVRGEYAFQRKLGTQLDENVARCVGHIWAFMSSTSTRTSPTNTTYVCGCESSELFQ